MLYFLLGSSSRQDRLPYSDIEFALVYQATDSVSQLRAYLYTLLSLLEFAVISLGETQNFHLGGEAGFHLDSSDHILSLEKHLIGTVEELYQYHVESTLFQCPGSLVLAGDLGEEGKGQMLYALLTPLLINHEWGGEALFLSFKQKVECLLSRPVDAWTQETLKIAYEKEKLIRDPLHKVDLPLSQSKKSTQLIAGGPTTQRLSALLADEEETPTLKHLDFELFNDPTASLTYRQLIALYSWADVLRKAEKSFQESQKTGSVNIKEVCHKPLVYLALNLQLFLGSKALHAVDMFEAAFEADILPFGVKELFQQMLRYTIALRSGWHLNKSKQEEEGLFSQMSLEERLTIDIITSVMHRPLRVAMESLFTSQDLSQYAWKIALREAFGKVWIHYSKERLGWQQRLPTHPLLTCLKDFPGPEGTRPSIDQWLAQKSLQLNTLCCSMQDAQFREKIYRKQPTINIERVQDRQRFLFRLHPAAVDQLIQAGYLNIIGQLQFSETQVSKEKGRHLVMPVTLPATKETVEFTVYIKVYPEMPALELAVTELSLLLIGPSLPWTELVRLTSAGQSYPVLFSQGISGPLLSDALQSANTSFTLAPQAYSQRVLLSLLLNQEDAKPSNLIAQSSTHSPNMIELISIDNDRSFYPGLVLDESKKQLIPQVKDITFCFNEMQHPIDLKVREAFLALDAYGVLSSWLMLAQGMSYNLSVLFTDKEIKTYFPKSGMAQSVANIGRFFYQISVPEESILSLMLREGIVETLYTKITRLQNYLRRYPNVTHLELFKVAEPYLSSYYERLLLRSESASKRFYRGFGVLYDMTANITENILEKLPLELPTKTTTFQTLETQQGKAITLQDLIKRKHLKESLSELEYIHKAQIKWCSILKGFETTLGGKNGITQFEQALSLFKKLTSELQAKIINHLDFSKVLGGIKTQEQIACQKKIINAMIKPKQIYPVLCFRYCDVLTDQIFEALLQSSSEIQSLSLVRCSVLSSGIIKLINYYVPGLKRLVLQELNWQELSIIPSISSQISFFQPQKKEQHTWSALEVFVIRNCSQLQSFHLSLKELKRLVVTRCDAIVDLRLDCPSLTHPIPHSLAALQSSLIKVDNPPNFTSREKHKYFHTVMFTTVYSSPVEHLKALSRRLEIDFSHQINHGVLGVGLITFAALDTNQEAHKIRMFLMSDIERSASISRMYFRNSDAIIGVYNIDAFGAHFDNSHVVTDHIRAYMQNFPNKPVILLGGGDMSSEYYSDSFFDVIKDTLSSSSPVYSLIIDSRVSRRWLLDIICEHSQQLEDEEQFIYKKTNWKQVNH